MKCSNYTREEDADGPGLRDRHDDGLKSDRKKKVLKLATLDHRGHAEKCLIREHNKNNT